MIIVKTMKNYHCLDCVILQITLEAMKSDVDEISLQGIEFWSTVCDEEVDLAIELSEVGTCKINALYALHIWVELTLFQISYFIFTSAGAVSLDSLARQDYVPGELTQSLALVSVSALAQCLSFQRCA